MKPKAARLRFMAVEMRPPSSGARRRHDAPAAPRLCCGLVAIAKANEPLDAPGHGDRTLSVSFLSLSIVALAF